MKRSKWFFLVLTIAMAALVVAGCGSGSNNSSSAQPDGSSANPPKENGKKIKVNYWNLLGGPDGEILLEIIKEYNAQHPDVEIVSQTQDWGQFYTKLRTAVLGGNSPDLAMSHLTRVLELQTSKVVEPIDDAAQRLGVDINYNDYVSAVLDETMIDGKRYALPFDNLLQVLYYNKKLAKQYGLADADGNLTIQPGYDNFIAALESIKQQDAKMAPLVAGQTGFNPVLSWFSMYSQMGATQFLSDDLKKTNLEEDKALQALESLKRLYSFVPPKMEKPDEFFKTGKSVFLFDGSWAGNAYYQAMKEDFGVVPFPYLFDVETMWSDSQGFVLPVNPKRSDETTKAALEFVKWFGENNWKWAKAGQISATKSSFASPEFQALPVVNQYVSALEKQVATFPATEKVWILFAPEVSEPIEKLINANAAPADVLKQIEDRLNASLK